MDFEATWYKDAIIYELHVRAFYDKDGDGIGDFEGLAERIDYFRDLGVTAIWLLPFYPSPLRDDGYDIADYTAVHDDYGTMVGFRKFLREAHRRDIKVITELVINHTSDHHPWFQAARKAPPNSSKRNFYVWSDAQDRFGDARIIFKDFEASNWSWDSVAKAYYWHRFYAHQPDLNFDNPAVQRAVFGVMDFWLRMGVDGLRLDAIPYLFEREGTSCENLPETHQFLKKLRGHVERSYRNRMLLAEANQWPEDAMAYFGNGDESHMNFHFPLMPRMFMALSLEDRFPIIDILQQTPPIPDTCQWAVFLRNHDELTLEMVTDEERDYMYRAYAHERQMRINLGIRRRLAPLMGNNRRKIELMNGLLFSMPGTPVLYYGDEIGMGDNVFLGDRNGVRTPLQWSPDRNAGFSRANPQRLYLPVIIDPEYHYEAINIETQRNNPQSLFWWMKRLISLRKRFRAFGRGSMEFLLPENPRVLAFVRRYEDECLLVVANLSRFSQFVHLDLAAFQGMFPLELFGHTQFPTITEAPYPITMGPHAFHWFSLKRSRDAIEIPAPAADLPQITVHEDWEHILVGEQRSGLEAVLPGYLPQCRWYGFKTQTVREANLVEAVPVTADEPRTYLTLLRVVFGDGTEAMFVLPVGFASGERSVQIQEHHRPAVISRIRVSGGEGEQVGILYDASVDPRFAETMLHSLVRRRRFKGRRGQFVANPTRNLRELMPEAGTEITPMAAEQSNTSVVFGRRLIMKLFRAVQEGINPDLEIGLHLTKRTSFTASPPVAGSLEYVGDGDGESRTLAVFQGYVQNEGDAWKLTLYHLRGFFDSALSEPEPLSGPAAMLPGQLAGMDEPLSEGAENLIGAYLESAKLLGQRTAEMHMAMCISDDPHFVPEPISPFYKRSLYQSMRNLVVQAMRLLDRRLSSLPESVRPDAREVLNSEQRIMGGLQAMLDQKISATRIRCHGDYHLGQVLYTGRDFVIIDFEGEPARPISERRIKKPALQDVAGMLRSFDYAVQTVLGERLEEAVVSPDDAEKAIRAARFWYFWVGRSFFKGYLETAGQASFLPRSRKELETLLRAHLFEKAAYELRYELDNRPNWVRVPLRGIRELLADGPVSA